MVQLIDKSALVAEIERRIADGKIEIKCASHKDLECYFEGYEDGLVLLKEQFLDTLEVKEVDIEKELREFVIGDIEEYDIEVAKHFYELGLKANQASDEVKIGETRIYLDDDGGEPPYDGKQWLDISCTEYEIPKDKFNDGDDVEIIIRKTQKGE